MNIKCILLNEKHQNEQATYCVVPFTFHYVKRKLKNRSVKNRPVIARDLTRVRLKVGETQRISLHVEIIPYDTIVVDTTLSIFLNS